MNLSSEYTEDIRSLSGKECTQERGTFYAKAIWPKAAAHRLHAVFHVFRGWQPDLSAGPGSQGRHPFLACLSGPGHQCRGAARCRSGGCGPGPGSGKAGRPGAPGVCPGLYDPDLPVHWPLPGHPTHCQHLLCHADPPGGHRGRAAAGVLGGVFCGGLSGGPAAGKAHPLAGQAAVPLPAGADPRSCLAAACCTPWQGSTAPPPRSIPLVPYYRAYCMATRPWTPWQP